MFAYCGNNPVNNVDEAGTCYYDAKGNWRHDNWEYIGDYYKQHPDPHAVDITEKLNNAMENHRAEIQMWKDRYGVSIATYIFYQRVKPGGAWDFKSQPSWDLEYNSTYLYGSVLLRFDDPGNIHYGYVGSALFGEDILKIAGGAVQIWTGTSDIAYWKSYFDDPRDQAMIALGYSLSTRTKK